VNQGPSQADDITDAKGEKLFSDFGIVHGHVEVAGENIGEGIVKTELGATLRAGLAAATPIAHLIQKLASDSNPIVRAALASSPHIPHDIQRLLFEKKDPRILQSLLENPRTAPDILEDFARLRFLSIEHRLRTHPNTPPHIRERLFPKAAPRRDP